MTKVYIDPRCKINYASYYILGLYQKLGKRNVKFNLSRFLCRQLNCFDVQWHGMSLINQDSNSVKKVYIDYHDSKALRLSAYEWCDVYAKVNLDVSDSAMAKVLAIGPGFGVDIWNWVQLVFFACRNLLVTHRYLKLPKKQYLLDYLYTKLRRKKYSSYIKEGTTSRSNYIFSVSTLWFPNYVGSTNEFRKEFFIQAAKYFRFEGGFYKIPSNDLQYLQYSKGFNDHIINNRVSISEYLNKTKMSLIVFNTPAVDDCDGWEFAEYLAVGKAIISMPILRLLPADASHILIQVENISQIKDVLCKIDQSEIESFERKTSQYFQRYLSPRVVIERILLKSITILHC